MHARVGAERPLSGAEARISGAAASRGPSGPLSGKRGVTSLAVVGTDHLHVVDLVTKFAGAGVGCARDRPERRSDRSVARQAVPGRARRRPVRRRRRPGRHRRDPERTRADRDRRHARRQGRRGRQARCHLVRATRCIARGVRRDGSQVHGDLRGAARQPGHDARATTCRIGPHRHGRAHDRARPALAEPEAEAAVVLRPRSLRRDPRRHRLAPGRPVPRVHRRNRRAGRCRARAAPMPIIPASRCSAR